MRKKRALIKYGGSALDDRDAAHQFAGEVGRASRENWECVVVHGGGKALSAWMKRIGAEVRFVDGLRYTDAASLELAEMVLSGVANKALTALLCAAGIPAAGVSARDAELCVASRSTSRTGADLGLVGEIHTVKRTLIDTLLSGGVVPVISPIASDGRGGALNCNADHVAAELAVHAGCETLLLLTDVEGVRVAGQVLHEISAHDARALLDSPEVTGGMRPKIEYALRAVERGVTRAVIAHAATPHVTERVLRGESIGTRIVGREGA